MRRCFDCRSAMPVDGTDSCVDCQEAHDERDYLERYCAAEHSGIGCDCESLAFSVALARVLVSVASLNEIAESEAA